MNINSYEAKILGKEYYLDIARKNNLLTKNGLQEDIANLKKILKKL